MRLPPRLAAAGRNRVRLLRWALIAALLLLLGAWLAKRARPPPDPYALADERAGAGQGPVWPADGGAAQPRRIPRLIHQTFRNSCALTLLFRPFFQAHVSLGLKFYACAGRRRMPAEVARLMASWRALNPSYEVRLYDDDDCNAFVEREFPQYARPYR